MKRIIEGLQSTSAQSELEKKCSVFSLILDNSVTAIHHFNESLTSDGKSLLGGLLLGKSD